MEFEKSKTFENLKSAFAGECQAYMAYSFYGAVADDEGIAPLAILMNETAENEKEHAEVFFKKINSHGENDELPNAVTGLARAIRSERFEAIQKYMEFEKIAEQEGFPEIADLFQRVRKIEESHMKHFQEMMDSIRGDRLYKGSRKTMWVCTKCGNIEYGDQPPEECPVCKHEGTYYRKEI